jgi:hypothetical protein
MLGSRYIIIDLDDTVVDSFERTKACYCHRCGFDAKRWTMLIQYAKPIPGMVDLVKALSKTYRILFVTSRPIAYQAMTRRWLERCLGGLSYQLIMRPEDNTQGHAELKLALVRNLGLEFKDIALVIEDNSLVVDAWRGVGVLTLQAKPGFVI